MSLSSAPYPLQRNATELSRLRVQADSLGRETAVMLDRLPIGQGWRCLDLGCGVGGIVDLLSTRVGSQGRVVGLDIDQASLAAARQWTALAGLDNVDFGSALSLLKPGGVRALQEADGDGLAAYPEHPAWDRLKAVLIELFRHIGADPHAGRRIFRMLLQAGLEDVAFRPCQAGARATDPLANYMPDTIASVRSAILEYRLMTAADLDDAVAQCQAHLAKPTTTSTSVIVIQAWGRKHSR